MDRDKIILAIAKRNLLVRSRHACQQYVPELPQDLSSTNCGGDFYECSVDSIRAALEEAFEAGKAHADKSFHSARQADELFQAMPRL